MIFFVFKFLIWDYIIKRIISVIVLQKEVVNIKYIFWNIKGKNLFEPIVRLILENNIDIIALTETDLLDIHCLINELRLNNQDWKLVEICPVSDIKLLAKRDIRILVHEESKRFSTYKLYNENDLYLLNVLHLDSAMYKDEYARSQKGTNISQILRKTEESMFKNEEYKTITIGDFNLQPYSQGVIGYYGFNATMSKSKAKNISRKVDDEQKYFYFNPMWKLMGDNRLVQGTYYNNSDQQDRSMFWYTFDQLLIRPFLIDKFNWDFFDIIEGTRNYSFIRNGIINKTQYSDHLPLKFEIL